MKKLLALGALVFAFAVPAASAQAAPISTDYCELSLRGGGTLAPDNEIKNMWDDIEAGGADVILSQVYAWERISDQRLSVVWRFFVNGDGSRYARFECYRDGYVASGTYRDKRVFYFGRTPPY